MGALRLGDKKANGIFGGSIFLFLQHGDSRNEPDGDKAVFSLWEKICCSCAVVNKGNKKRKEKKGKALSTLLVNCGYNSDFRREKKD